MYENEVERVSSRYRKSENEGEMRQCGEIISKTVLSGGGRFSRRLGWVSDGRLSGSAPSSHLQVAVGVRERRLGVIHGQHQTRAPHHQLMIAVRQLSVQVVAAAGAGGVGADGDVAVAQVDVAVRQDEVRVVIFQLALILCEKGNKGKQKAS